MKFTVCAGFPHFSSAVIPKHLSNFPMPYLRIPYQVLLLTLLRRIISPGMPKNKFPKLFSNSQPSENPVYDDEFVSDMKLTFTLSEFLK